MWRVEAGGPTATLALNTNDRSDVSRASLVTSELLRPDSISDAAVAFTALVQSSKMAQFQEI